MVNENLITIIVNTIMQVFTGGSLPCSLQRLSTCLFWCRLSLIVARLIISIFFGGVENDDDSA